MKYFVGAVAMALSAAGAPRAEGQVLQLPSFDYFSVRTSVLVPDRGGAYLGGVGRLASGSSHHGPPGWGRWMGNRARGSSGSAGGMSVHATVIDSEALDRAVLAEAARRRGGSATVDGRGADPSEKSGTTVRVASPASAGLMSIEEIRRENAVRKQSQQAEAWELFARAEAAESQGRRGAAKIFYQMAQRRGDAELRQLAAARLHALGLPGGRSANSP